MGFSYRKSLVFGPFRANISKSGVGYSLGAGGFRLGRSGTGRSYQTFSLPGTGLRYYTSKGGKGRAGCLGTGCLLLVAASTAFLVLGLWLMAG